MRSKNKQILVVGDRVLIKPDKGEKKSKGWTGKNWNDHNESVT